MKWRLWIAVALVLPLVACRTNPPAPIAPPPPPAFLGAAPYSWQQLGTLEAWLDGPGAAANADARIEAELALAEGRLAYAKQDAGKVPAATLVRRVSSADSGFRRVLAAGDASALARHRARAGLEAARALKNTHPPKPAAGVALQARSSWGARSAITAMMTRQSRVFTRITVHHSAPPAALPLGAGQQVYTDEIRRLQRYHMEQVSPRCGDIGYHFLIDPNGTIYEGRSLDWQGAHAGGTNNVNNIGVCMLGDFRSSTPSTAALASLQRLLDDLRAANRIPRDAVHIKGHMELKATECPGDVLMVWVKRYRQ
jgi:N-acetylmuramoyl-L-alanine amidase